MTRFRRRSRQLCESKGRHRNDAVVVTAMWTYGKLVLYAQSASAVIPGRCDVDIFYNNVILTRVSRHTVGTWGTLLACSGLGVA